MPNKIWQKSLHLHGIHVISTWLIDFNRCWVSPPFLWTKKTHPALLRQIRKIIQAQTTRSRTTGQGVSDQMFTFGRGSRSGKKNISYHHIRTKQIKADHIIILQICKDEYRLCLEIFFSCESASTPMRCTRKIQEGFPVTFTFHWVGHPEIFTKNRVGSDSWKSSTFLPLKGWRNKTTSPKGFSSST